MTRGEAARDEVRRNAFKTLFPDQAARLEELGRRVDILEAKLAEQNIVAGPRRRTAAYRVLLDGWGPDDR
jgi:hypothetical protein